MDYPVEKMPEDRWSETDEEPWPARRETASRIVACVVGAIPSLGFAMWVWSNLLGRPNPWWAVALGICLSTVPLVALVRIIVKCGEEDAVD
ncbi:hypothetical protein [Amycolatopsis pithecellobii]|uniref:DUF2530 domain-containing protein n=1 Tax=Amycolatopsis pithecellobii TaxID=664692 RepID=A0A6N7Z605_9PSEU|nr:hypothetical protein [Amycolatopsis pithecellobii]MTD56090.1 hypothetical protein [Amycolatopsis pithecellobii]